MLLPKSDLESSDHREPDLVLMHWPEAAITDDPIIRAKNGDTSYFKRTPVKHWVDAADWEDGDSVLGKSVVHYHVHCSKVIYERCPELLHRPSKRHGYNVLHHAAWREEKPSLLKFVISIANGDLYLYRTPYSGNITALSCSIHNFKFVSTEILLEADPEHLTLADDNGRTPLLSALRSSYGKPDYDSTVKMRRLLLEKQPDASKVRTGKNGWTALHHVSADGDIGAVEDIITFSPDTVHMLDNDGNSFLKIAISRKHDELVNYILQKKESEGIPLHHHHQKKKSGLYVPSWKTMNRRELELCIPPKYLLLYRKLVTEFGEIVLPKVQSEDDPTNLALGCFLSDAAEIVKTKPKQVSQEQILEWEKMAKQYSALGLQLSWFEKHLADYKDWFEKKAQHLGQLDDDIASKRDKYKVKLAEYYSLENELDELNNDLEELQQQRDTYEAESDQTEFGLQRRLNTYIAYRLKLRVRIAKLPLQRRARRRYSACFI